jgi:hypothetical protein
MLCHCLQTRSVSRRSCRGRCRSTSSRRSKSAKTVVDAKVAISLVLGWVVRVKVDGSRLKGGARVGRRVR